MAHNVLKDLRLSGCKLSEKFSWVSKWNKYIFIWCQTFDGECCLLCQGKEQIKAQAYKKEKSTKLSVTALPQPFLWHVQ